MRGLYLAKLSTQIGQMKKKSERIIEKETYETGQERKKL